MEILSSTHIYKMIQNDIYKMYYFAGEKSMKIKLMESANVD